jgi:hypothetical protein
MGSQVGFGGLDHLMAPSVRQKAVDGRRSVCYLARVIRIVNLLPSSALLLQCAAVGF